MKYENQLLAMVCRELLFHDFEIVTRILMTFGFAIMVSAY